MSDDRPILKRSANTERALRMPRPRLRGRSHLVAALSAPLLVITWVASTPTGIPRVAIAVFGTGMAVMLTISAVLHLRRWSPTAYERLFRLDHSGIHVAIGSTGAALALLGLVGWPARLLFTVAVIGSLAGIIVEWLPFAAPRGVNSAIYLTIGWTPVVVLPWLWSHSGVLVTGLLIAGGVLYTLGAVVVGLRRPDPSPRWFGYHEIFHLLVLAAIGVHAAMFEVLVRRVG